MNRSRCCPRTALVDALAELGDSAARGHVAKRVDELHHINEEITTRITELEGLTSQHALSEIEFDLLRQLLSVFKNSIDDMSIGQTGTLPGSHRFTFIPSV